MSESKPGGATDPEYGRPPTELEKTIKKKFLMESMPRVELKMLFSAHSDKAQAEKLREEIAKVDILLIEGLGASPEFESILNQFAKGAPDLGALQTALLTLNTQSSNNEWMVALTSILYDSSREKTKAVRFLDLPEEEVSAGDLMKQADSALNFISNMEKEYIPYEEATRAYEQKMEVFSHNVVAKRDKYAASMLMPKILDALKTNRDLRSRKPIRVRVVYGTAHTGIFHKVKGKEGVHPAATRTIYTEMPLSYDLEIARKKAWGIPVDSELIARGFSAGYLPMLAAYSVRRFEDDPVGNFREAKLARAIISQYTEQELHELYDHICSTNPEVQAAALAKIKEKALLVFRKEFPEGGF